MVKCKMKINQMLYPKYGHQNGDWGIILCTPIETIEGTVIVDYKGKFKVKGNLPLIALGEEYTLIAEEVNDPEYGQQYECVFLAQLYPEELLKSNDFLKFIVTEVQAVTLTNAFEHPMEIIAANDIEQLTSVKGIGVKTATRIVAQYNASKDYSHAYVTLHNYGLTKNLIDRLIDEYGSPDIVVELSKTNPYAFVNKVEGIGIKTADEIALKMGIAPDSKVRIKAMIQLCLEEETLLGNSWISPSYLSRILEEKMGEVDKIVRKDCFHELFEEDVIWWNEKKTIICLKQYLDLEKNIVKELFRLSKAKNDFVYADVEAQLIELEKEQGWEYTSEQKEAIMTGLNENVLAISGAAGTGKSSIINAIVKILSNYSVAQTALAAKAAKRMEEITGLPSYTIHRLLGWTRTGFTYNRDCPMYCDIVILDECSMVGGILFYQLIQAIKTGGKFIMVGDHAQLEAIGILNVFKDILDCENIPTKILTKIHRQAAKSAIITDSINVRNGKQIIKKGWEGSETKGELQDFVVDIFEDRSFTPLKAMDYFKEKYGELKDINQVQVITPTKYKGDASVYSLNKKIQQFYNPPSNSKNEIRVGFNKGKEDFSYTLREGDKIIIRKNNYKDVSDMNGKSVPIFNGTMGTIVEIDERFGSIVVDFTDAGKLLLPKKIWKGIELGYAITVHSCLVKDTLILTEKGIVEIGDIDNGAQLGEFKTTNMNIKVFNGEGFETPSGFYHGATSPCKTFKTKRGYEITTSLDHRLDILDNDGHITWKYAEDINDSDVLILRKGSEIYGDNILLPEAWQERSLNARTIIYNRPTELTEDFAKFLGYMVADGCLFKRGIRFTKRDSETVEDFRDIVLKLFGYNGEVVLGKSGNIYECTVASKDIVQFLENIEGISPHDKFIPKIIMQASKSMQCAFLRSLFEDGTVNLKKGRFDHIELSMKNKKMLKQLQVMLINMGVITSCSTRKTREKFPINTLYIYKKDAQEFYRITGFVCERKQHNLSLCMDDFSRISERKTISSITKIIDILIKKYSLVVNANIYLSIRENKITEFMLDRFLRETEEKISNDVEYKYLKNILENFYFDAIIEIKDSEEEVFCIEMPETHKFVQGGFMGWNCQGSQYSTVIFALDYSAYSLLTREMVYTGMTRASNMCILCAEGSALNFAINTSNVPDKQTFMPLLLGNNNEII